MLLKRLNGPRRNDFWYIFLVIVHWRDWIFLVSNKKSNENSKFIVIVQCKVYYVSLSFDVRWCNHCNSFDITFSIWCLWLFFQQILVALEYVQCFFFVWVDSEFQICWAWSISVGIENEIVNKLHAAFNILAYSEVKELNFHIRCT